MIFDGKAFAREIEDQVKVSVEEMGKKIKIVSVVVGDDPASALYSRLKKEAAERVGIQFDVVKLDKDARFEEIDSRLRQIGKKEDVTGVMIQLPLPESLRGSTPKLIQAIPLDKDVDGLRWEESGVKPATVRAVLSILDEIAKRKSSEHSPKIAQGSELWEQKFVVVGARGAVGRPLVHFLKERGVEVFEIEWDTPNPAELTQQADVVISCVGKPGVVTGEMVKEGVVAINVGMSMINNQAPINNNQTNQNNQNSKQSGDWNLSIDDSRHSRVVGDMTDEVYQKASISVPVRGGVGPVTIASLLQNTVELYGRK